MSTFEVTIPDAKAKAFWQAVLEYVEPGASGHALTFGSFGNGEVWGDFIRHNRLDVEVKLIRKDDR